MSSSSSTAGASWLQIQLALPHWSLHMGTWTSWLQWDIKEPCYYWIVAIRLWVGTMQTSIMISRYPEYQPSLPARSMYLLVNRRKRFICNADDVILQGSYCLWLAVNHARKVKNSDSQLETLHGTNGSLYCYDISMGFLRSNNRPSLWRRDEYTKSALAIL